jgi:hypothetical protein
MSIKDRQKLLQDAGITVHISADQGLAVRASCAFPWSKMREIHIHNMLTIHMLVNAQHSLKASGVVLVGEEAAKCGPWRKQLQCHFH